MQTKDKYRALQQKIESTIEESFDSFLAEETKIKVAWYGCVYPPKSRAVATYQNHTEGAIALCLLFKIESSRNLLCGLLLLAKVVFTLQNREQSQHTNTESIL